MQKPQSQLELRTGLHRAEYMEQRLYASHCSTCPAPNLSRQASLHQGEEESHQPGWPEDTLQRAAGEEARRG